MRHADYVFYYCYEEVLQRFLKRMPKTCFYRFGGAWVSFDIAMTISLYLDLYNRKVSAEVCILSGDSV